MRKINYPMIVSDFDGTLVKADGTIDRETKNQISQYVNDGGIFVVSTGRMPSGILPRVQELGLKGFVSCCQGSIIMNAETEEVILQATIPSETTYEICKKMEELGLHIHIYGLWDYYSNMDDAALKYYENAVRSKAKLVLDKPISQFVKEREFCAYKVLAMVHPEDNAAIFKALQDAGFNDCTVTKSDAVLVEVINSNYSKGTAVEFLAKQYNIPLEKTVGVGDQLNDLPMIQKAGLGIAVKNAAPELKKEALEFAYSNEENAIGHIIEQYGYTEE
ncbi:MAG: HAD family hydrolase [Clostridiales bacterium]|nr:HAD family hydrolase [Clostridiales bacterium]